MIITVEKAKLITTIKGENTFRPCKWKNIGDIEGAQNG